MSESRENLDAILNEATDLTEGRLSYVTTARFSVTMNEVYVDLYTLAPNPGDLGVFEAHRLHRVAMPLAVAKDLATKMLEGINHWENSYGINLPLKALEDSEREV